MEVLNAVLPLSSGFTRMDFPHFPCCLSVVNLSPRILAHDCLLWHHITFIVSELPTRDILFGTGVCRAVSISPESCSPVELPMWAKGLNAAHFLLIPLICFQKVDNGMHLHSSERSQLMDDLIVDPWKTGMFGRGIRQKRRLKSNKTRWCSKWSDKVTFHFDGSPWVVLKCFDGAFHVGSWSWALCFSVRAPVSSPNELSFKLAFVWL